MRTVGLTLRSASAPIRPRVSGVRGRWTVMTSLSASSSSSGTSRTPAGRRGRLVRTGRRRAPDVERGQALRDQDADPAEAEDADRFAGQLDAGEPGPLPLPAASDAGPAATLRSDASSRPTACSAALTMFECGALTTMTPALVAASTSTLSSPTPARATTRSRLAARDRLGVDLRGAAHEQRVGLGQRGQQAGPVGAVAGSGPRSPVRARRSWPARVPRR